MERIAYVDVDVHHGDGVERAFWDDPRVLTVSLHESPRTLFPGTGLARPTSVARGAEGHAVNVALPVGTTDAGWLRAFHAVVPAVVEAFEPQLLVSQHGCDSHAEDPLAHLLLSVDGAAGELSRAPRARAPSRRRPVGGASAAAATRSSTSSRAPGPTCVGRGGRTTRSR